jgi:hypothetical protein
VPLVVSAFKGRRLAAWYPVGAWPSGRRTGAAAHIMGRPLRRCGARRLRERCLAGPGVGVAWAACCGACSKRRSARSTDWCASGGTGRFWRSVRVARVGCTVALGAVCVCYGSRDGESVRHRVESIDIVRSTAAGAAQLAVCAVSARSACLPRVASDPLVSETGGLSGLSARSGDGGAVRAAARERPQMGSSALRRCLAGGLTGGTASRAAEASMSEPLHLLTNR